MSTILAAIDIGSNAIRLLFAHVYQNEQGQIQILKTSFIRVPIRLGEDVFSHGCISDDRRQKLIQTMRAFKALIDVNDVEAFDACATAAMREAENGLQIIEEIKAETGIQVRLIDGLEEADIIRSAGRPEDLNRMSVYVDVGGGSTEISVIHQGQFVNAQSFNIGTLRILNGKVTSDEWDRMRQWLERYQSDFSMIDIIGSGGNINKATKLFGDRSKQMISAKNLKQAYKRLSQMTIEERMKEYRLRDDRADVIVPALEIFLHILKTTQCDRIVVPKFGLVDGLIVQLYKQRLEAHPNTNLSA